MPYSQRLIANRKHASQTGSNLRAVRRAVVAQEPMRPEHRERVLAALDEALHLLYASVDYLDDGTLLGIAGEYEQDYPPRA